MGSDFLSYLDSPSKCFWKVKYFLQIIDRGILDVLYQSTER